MALENESPQQQQQSKRTKTLASSDKVEDPQSTHTLLPEIVMEILSRLPVESLLRCKSVRKSWRSLISDPHFVKYHLSFSNSNSDYAHLRLVMYTGRTRVWWCSLHDVIYDKSVNMFELDYPLKHLQKTICIAGSCNGLLCITVEDDHVEEESVFIWNPSTRQQKRLPYSGLKTSALPVYGFGYEESSNDYKVVLIAWCFENETNYGTRVMIYCLNSGNWKRIYDFPNDIFIDGFSQCSNGALHWTTRLVDGSSSLRTIISLDLATETYGEVLQPEYDEGDKNLHLEVQGECLCLVSDYSENRRIDVWVMKVYGVKDSWTKLASIQNLADPAMDPF